MKKILSYLKLPYYIVMIYLYEARASRRERQKKGRDRWEF